MEANNTSAFNYREITGGGRLSNHAYGRAIDINILLNPYIRNGIVLPHGAKRERFIVERLDGKASAETIAALWTGGHATHMVAAQVKVFCDQLAERGLVA